MAFQPGAASGRETSSLSAAPDAVRGGLGGSNNIIV